MSPVHFFLSRFRTIANLRPELNDNNGNPILLSIQLAVLVTRSYLIRSYHSMELIVVKTAQKMVK